MPRVGRLHIPGGCYHLIGRGLERRHIFESPADKADFLTRFGDKIAQHKAQCLAWALMSNHYHFLIRAGCQPLGKLMAGLLGGFAGSYNRRHGRNGYVFQNRFTSILCDEDNYLLELVRYIHLNPVRASLIYSMQELDHYPWTGHAGLLGRHRQNWHAAEEILLRFGDTREKAVRTYWGFVQAGITDPDPAGLSGGDLVRSNGSWESLAQQRQEHLVRIGDERILGDSDFVEMALKQDEIAIQMKTRLQRDGMDLDKLIKQVCYRCGVHESDIMMKSRDNKVSRAKALICYWGTRKLGVKARDIADRLNISQPAVSKWVSQGWRDKEMELLEINS